MGIDLKMSPALQECWIRRLRRDALEGRLGTDPADPNACAFASIIGQCDVLEMSRAERVGNCAKCTYFSTQSQAQRVNESTSQTWGTTPPVHIFLLLLLVGAMDLL